MSKPIRKFTYDAAGGGACCKTIHVTLTGEMIESVEFVRGCDGNHRGIESLVKGRGVREVIDLLHGIRCGSKATSCPDQLARALRAAMEVSAR